MARTAIDRLRRKAARTGASGSARSGRAGVLAALLAVLIVVLAGLPDDRYASLMPRGETPGTALSAASAGLAASPHAWKADRRTLSSLTAADADDPPTDDRRLVPDAIGFERLSPDTAFPPRTSAPLPSAAASLPERPPKSA
ncbi:hypothetical protein [Methylobacterium oxalidis]|uniref:Uncharacterized protein n=1 Tax=Methylobacterium oxalidis TaxID=944322 RepID=A0A512JA02_9HYPH|nr:hypothetical protein [Methylobacterium oxalidis]GEP06709.1 hypothetical protein MOX02_47470 [Methylobacterium oxalidis]GJE32906.1 hypothetical protein LDDCCGHA_3102 [Methylobacterium oxalidis]GLS67281.1 hypothetical protein GCM10007888_56640 [Methylobacterium oxalidis]